MEKKIGIILLNYKNYNDTIECMKSIQKQNYSNYEIVVVDNSSQNESIKKINDFIKGKTNMHIIANNINLGFAKGNNVGIKFAKNKLKCDFIFVLNADTILEDRDTLKKLINSYVPKRNIAIINPLCCDLDGNVQLPYLISNSKMWRYCLKIGIYLLKQGIKLTLNLERTHKNKNINIEAIEDSKYIIQGCAYILTPDFFNYYTQIYPETFLYCEEMALGIYIEKINMRTVINKEVVILHKEGGSSAEILKDKKKRRFKYQLKSYFKVIKLLGYNYEKIKRKFND